MKRREYLISFYRPEFLLVLYTRGVADVLAIRNVLADMQ
jgi:hypothetical protein